MAYIETKVHGVKYNTDNNLFVVFHNDTAIDAFSIDELSLLIEFHVKFSREAINEANSRTGLAE